MMRTIELIALCGVLLPAHAAFAQEAEPPAEYEQLIEEALSESANGNWEDARAAFRQAHAAFPNARTERGIGMVSFEIRDYVDSVRHLRRALSNEVRPLTEEQRTEVQSLLTRALGRVAIFSLANVPEGADITIDGRAVEPEDDGTLMLPIGEHAVVVSGAHRWESSIPVRGGENAPLPMRFEAPVVEDTPPPRITPPVAPPPETGPPDGSLALTLGGVVGFLAGAGVLIAGAVTYFEANGAGPMTEWADVSGSYAITQPLQGIGYGVMGLGAALTIGGAIWMTTGSNSRPSAQLQLRGTF
ncbi:MAG: hypothetical protein H6719_13835 [Sandaracinaceae bacterium]|nr:hypothetical protein [Sandaracinaceae bacterium]